MKKASSILCAGLLILAASCNKSNQTAPVAVGSTDAAAAVSGVRYVSQDSILKYYTYADVVSQQIQEQQAKLMAYGNQLQSMANNLQNEFNQKLQNNQFLTQQLAENEARNVQQKLQGYDSQFNKRQAEVQTQVLALQQTLADSIHNFIDEFVKANPYDAIVLREGCLYVNPALDITQQIIDGLNARYQVPAPTK